MNRGVIFLDNTAVCKTSFLWEVPEPRPLINTHQSPRHVWCVFGYFHEIRKVNP
jgi:hypothetical protein